MTAVKILARPRTRVAIDSLLLVGFIVVVATREASFDPNYGVHSVTGLALVAVLGLHLWANRAWTSRVLANRLADREARLAILNASFGVLAAVCIVSGIPLWRDLTDNELVAGLHVITGFGSVVAMVAHVAMSRRRLAGLLRAARR